MGKRVGVDLDALRTGREPLSDAQMHKLFDEVLEAAVELANERIPGFAGLREEAQWALLELIVWLGPEGWEAVISEMEHLSYRSPANHLSRRGGSIAPPSPLSPIGAPRPLRHEQPSPPGRSSPRRRFGALGHGDRAHQGAGTPAVRVSHR